MSMNRVRTLVLLGLTVTALTSLGACSRDESVTSPTESLRPELRASNGHWVLESGTLYPSVNAGIWASSANKSRWPSMVARAANIKNPS